MIAFDIDGVLADASHRLHHITERPKDWPAFFAGIPDDPAIEEGRRALLAAAEETTVVLVSGRPEHTRAATSAWLADHGFPELPVHLRREGDRRPAPVVKLGILNRLGGSAVVQRVVEDDPTVAELLRASGYVVDLVSGSGSIGA